MPYKGHVENGSIVLDEPAILKEGSVVQVEVLESVVTGSEQVPLRGTKYQFDDPFSPVVAEEDWDAAQ